MLISGSYPSRTEPEHGPDRRSDAIRSIRLRPTFIRRRLCIAAAGGWTALRCPLTLGRRSRRTDGTPALRGCLGRWLGVGIRHRLDLVPVPVSVLFLEAQFASLGAVLHFEVLEEGLAQQGVDVALLGRHHGALHVLDRELAHTHRGND